MQKFYNLVIFLMCILFCNSAFSQSVLNPADSVITYDTAHKPVQPAYGQIGKWVRTVRLSWNTSQYKCYIYNGRAFRLLFPKTYNPTAADGKKYPMMIFFHGVGEGSSSIYDNEYQLYHGGDVFKAAVNSGAFDGYVLCMQTSAEWGETEFNDLVNIINYMVANNKLDPFRVSDNGLSGGGQGTWEMLINHPAFISAAIPMSSTSIIYNNQNTINTVKYTPVWEFQGGLDGSPAPYTAHVVRDAIYGAGGNFTYTEYSTLGHGTWDSVWMEPDFWPFQLRAYASNPWTLTGRTAFCAGDSINANIGLAAGFDEYQWRKNGVLISGATSNSINVKDTGTYSARVRRGEYWSAWSRTPAHIIIKQPTVTPPITVSGLMSTAIPAPDGKMYVNLQVPDNGYVGYLWKKAGGADTLATSRILKVTQPGSYKVAVTELYGCSSLYSAPFVVVNAAGKNAPPPATGLTAQALSYTQVQLNWSNSPAPAYNETAFEIYRSVTPGSSYSFIGQVPADTITFTDKNLTPNVKYFYIVRAINNNGASAVSNEASAITQSDKISPTAPDSLRVISTTNTSVNLTWESSTDNVGVSRYDVYVNGVKTNSTTQTSVIIAGLAPSQQFIFYVKAVDISGNTSTSSNQVTAASVLNGFHYNYYENSWSVLPNFNNLPVVKSGNSTSLDVSVRNRDNNYGIVWQGFIRVPVDGTYKFETYSDDGSEMWLGKYDPTVAPLVNNDGLHGGQFAGGTITLKAGVYPVSVAYFQGSGDQYIQLYWTCQNLYSDNNRHLITANYFNDAYTPAGTAPAAPSDFAATGLDYTRINLTWKDNSSNETGFEVYRSTSLTGDYNIIATTGANVTSFTDSALSPLTKYYYEVVAVNQYGSSSTGLKYSYYTGSWNNLPDFSTLSPAAIGFINNVSLSPATSTVNYALKFEGTIKIPATGEYTFYTNSDDGSKLYIGGFSESNLVVNNDYLQAPTERSGKITLNQGTYPIYITYFQQGGGYYLDAHYEGPGITKQAIPDSTFTAVPAPGTTLSVPAAPAVATLLTATVKSPSAINLTWKDNGTNETGYSVYRSMSDTSHFKLIASLPSNSAAYADTTLFAHLTYYYKVTVLGVGGTAAGSAIISAKTKDNIPVITKIANRSVRYGITTVLNVTASDADGDSLVYSIINKPEFAAFKSNSNNTATLTLSPKYAQVGTYANVKVTVNDKNGGMDTTTFTLTVNSNYDPTINTIANYTINEGDSLNVNLVGQDQNAGDSLIWSVTGAPLNAAVKQVTATTSALRLLANYASAGAYTVQVSVSDGKGGTATNQFNITINDKNPVSTIYTRFIYTDSIGSPWNNITGITTNNLKDTNNNSTGVSLTLQTSWFAAYNSGSVTGNNSGIYPDAVLKDYYYFGKFGGPDSVSFKLSGLDTTKKYNLTFFAASLFPGTPDNGNTIYTSGAQTVSLYVQNNTKNIASLINLVPDSSGSIIVKMSKASNAQVGYLNALIINSVFDDGTTPLKPQLISAQTSGNGVKLNWQDLAYNESSYKIFRAANVNGTYSLVDTTAANVKAYTDTTVNGNTQYYYKLQANNVYGTSAYSNMVGVYVNDKIPVLTPVSDMIIKNSQQLTVGVTAKDDSTDHVTLTVSQLPPFVTFTDNGNGTGSFSIKPTSGTIGFYPNVTVTATDNSDSSSTVNFNITVTDNLTNSVYLNFSDGSLFASKPWNNLSGWPVAGKVYTNIVDQSNNATNINVTLVDGFQGVVASGVQPGNDKTIYPEAVVRTGLYEGSLNAKTIKISGLSTTKKYNFVFFGSHEDGLNGLTKFTVNGQTVSLNASYNLNKTVEINNISPDSTGNVVISVAKATNADYAYLSSLIIESYDSATVLPPSNLLVTDAKRTTVSLQWADRNYNESGFQVWRADDSNSTYSLINTVGANTVAYTDSNVTANKFYYYVVRAITPSGNSAYSNVAIGHTLAYAVYINFTTTQLGRSPWNNTATPPQAGDVFSNLLDEQDHVSNIGMTTVSAFAGEYTAGVNTGNNSGVYPDSVMAESYGLFAGQTGVIKITGLNLNMKYNFTFFASSTAYGDVNVAYTANGKTVILDASLNSTGTVTMYNVVPDINGEVTVIIAPAETASQFGLIGALVVQGFNASVPNVPAAPVSQTNSIAASGGKQPQQAIQNKLKDVAIMAYPNPFISSFTLSVTAKQGESINVQLYNVAGQMTYSNKFGNLFSGVNTFNIQPSGTVAGLYIIKIIFEDKTYKVLKLIKQ